MSRYKRLMISVLPVVGAKTFIRGVPAAHEAREVAGFYQTFGLVLDPISSYTYLTPAESMASVHLHSLLSVPLFISGSNVAGRIISLVAMAVAAAVLSEIAAQRIGDTAGFLAPALLWAHPLSMLFAVSWWPEALSIVLVVGIVYSCLRYLDAPSHRWWIMLLVLVALAPANHLWEASIAFPVVVVLLYAQRVRVAASVIGATIGSLAVIRHIKSLQPTGHDLSESYSVFSHPEPLFSLEWFFSEPPATINAPFEIGMAVLVPTAIVGVMFFAYTFYKSRSRLSLLFSSWFCSGLVILLILPRGWTVHSYYAWALLPPTALSVAWAGHSLIGELPRGLAKPTCRVVTAVLVLLTTTLIAAPLPWGPLHSGYELSDSELADTANKIDQNGIERASEIAFVGKWHGELRWHTFYQAPMVTDVLIRSRTPVYARGLRSDSAPQIVNSTANVTRSECSIMVIRDGEKTRVRGCE